MSVPDPRSVEAGPELDVFLETELFKRQRPFKHQLVPAYSLFDAHAVGVMRQLPERCGVYRMDARWVQAFSSTDAHRTPFQPEAGWWAAGTVEGGVIYCAPTFALAVCRAAVAHLLGFAVNYPTDDEIAALAL